MLRRVPTDRRLPPWRAEVLVGVVGYAAYQLVQIAVTGSASSAVDRADWLWSAERRLHLDPEVWLNHLLSGRHGMVVLAGMYYGILHFALTPSVLVWLRLRRAPSPTSRCATRSSVPASSPSWSTGCSRSPRPACRSPAWSTR